MDNISSFYLRKIIGRLNNEDVDPYTLAYKYGITKDLSGRDTRGEFLKAVNSHTPANSQPINYEAEVNEVISISAPKFFVTDLENFIKNEFFARDKKFISNRQEYINSHEQATQKFTELHNILQNIEPKLNDLKNSYKELTDSQTSLINTIKSNYNTCLDHIKNGLKKFVNPPVSKKLEILKTPIANIQNQQPAVDKKCLDDLLTTDFVLSKTKDALYLQHKEYHKDESDPTGKALKDPRGGSQCAWKANLINNKEPKFQFHNNPITANYDKRNISASRAHDIFERAGKIIDLDDLKVDLK